MSFDLTFKLIKHYIGRFLDPDIFWVKFIPGLYNFAILLNLILSEGYSTAKIVIYAVALVFGLLYFIVPPKVRKGRRFVVGMILFSLNLILGNLANFFF